MCWLFSIPKRHRNARFTAHRPGPKLIFVIRMHNWKNSSIRARTVATLALLMALSSTAPAQEPKKKAEAKAEPELPAQIELLETKYRFETNGDSRKEVYARVKINNALGEEQFARLNFQYNRSFQSVEIPLVKIIHPRGGTAEILPSAITDNPDPAVADFPAYQQVRQKSVRILGLAPGDMLEYRVVTTTTHPPLAPDFWLEHSFDRTGVVSHEIFEADVPTLPDLRVRIGQGFPPTSVSNSKAEKSDRKIYRWDLLETRKSAGLETVQSAPDLSVSTFRSWDQLADRIGSSLIPTEKEVRALHNRAAELTSLNASASQKASDLYDFVSKKIRTVDLPLGATGFQTRAPADILNAGYATAEDKFVLFATLADNFFGPARAGFISSTDGARNGDLPSPARFDHLLTMSGYPSITFWMDLNTEVAPFLMIPTQFLDKPVFVVGPSIENRWESVYSSFSSPSIQKVVVSARLEPDGKLAASVSYLMRGENELLLRLAFHQTPKEKWKEVAQLLALSDGFRGKVTSVSASDPYDTKDPFRVEYEVTQPKFVNWEKKPVRIPAILPLVGLPDPPQGDSTAKIELGTPLEVNLSATITLPPGTTAHVPPGTSVKRDYAEFSSEYAAQGETLTASRHLRFLMRQLPAERAFDYNAFVRAVQNDEGQDFTLEHPGKQEQAANAKK